MHKTTGIQIEFEDETSQHKAIRFAYTTHVDRLAEAVERLRAYFRR